MSIDASTDAANVGAVFDIKPGMEREGNNTRRRILLVFNQAHIVRVLKAQLEQTNYLVHTAHNAENALEMIHTDKFDAVAIDTELSGMGAVQLCMNINRQMRQAKPQLMLTGINAIELAEQRTDWPVNALGLAWPISMAELIGAIEGSEIGEQGQPSESAFAQSKVGNQR